MGKRTPPHKAYNTWTTARFWAFIRAGLRGMYRRWPPKFECLREARRAVKTKGRQKWEYQCVLCRKWHIATNVEVDHINPAGKLNTYADLPKFTERLFCSVEELQVVCKPCHKAKTAADRKGGK